MYTTIVCYWKFYFCFVAYEDSIFLGTFLYQPLIINLMIQNALVYIVQLPWKLLDLWTYSVPWACGSQSFAFVIEWMIITVLRTMILKIFGTILWLDSPIFTASLWQQRKMRLYGTSFRGVIDIRLQVSSQHCLHIGIT